MFRQWLYTGLLVLIGAPLWAEDKGIRVEHKEMVSEQRVALVIGNANYKIRPLNNPVNDAVAMVDALEKCGFTVLQYKDLNRTDMFEAVRAFGNSIKGGGVGLFYYSGHGIQVGGKNYLIPVDADIQAEDEVEIVCLDMQSVLNKMKSAQNRVKILILDACRDNPFADQYKSFGNSGGLAKMSAPSGTFIAYAAEPNKKAIDGNGSNSPFVSAFVEEMQKPGLSIGKLMINVRNKVRAATDSSQTPWEESSLTGQFYFRLSDSVLPNQRNDDDQLTPDLSQNTKLQQEKEVFYKKYGRQPAPRAVDNKGMTDLHKAAIRNLPQLTISLLDQGANIDARDGNGDTPLFRAVFFDAFETANVLLKRKANINLQDDNGMTWLHLASKENHPKIAKQLLKYGANPNVRDNEGATPLHWTAQSNAPATARVLLQYKAKPDARKRGVGMTPLHVAAVHNAYQTADVLLEHHANPNVTANSVTPLHVAAAQDAYDTAKVLLEYGANVNARNNRGATPLWAAQVHKAYRTAQVLSDHGGQTR